MLNIMDIVKIFGIIIKKSIKKWASKSAHRIANGVYNRNLLREDSPLEFKNLKLSKNRSNL